MAANLSSNKNLWVLISGTAVLKSQELVGSELEKNLQKVIKGTDYYKNFSKDADLDKQKINKSIKKEFLKELSQFMNVDINQTFDIICSYLLYEYKGSQSDIQSVLKSERHTHGLMVEIWNYYFSERLYAVFCLKQLLSHWQDSNHVYKNLYDGFLQSVNKNNADTIINSVLSQLQNSCSEPVPNKSTHGSLMTEMQATRWVKFKLNEMCELLQIVLLYYKDMEPHSKHVLTLFDLFQKQAFGLRHPYKNFINNSSDLLKVIGHLQVLVIIEALEFEWLYQCQSAGLEFHLFKDKEIFLKLNASFNFIGSQLHHGPILSSWMLVLHYGGKALLSKSEQGALKQLAKKSIKLETFNYLLSCLDMNIFKSNTVISKLAHEIVYSLLSLLLSTFEESTLGDIQALYKLCFKLLRYTNVVEDFWKKGFENGLGIVFSNLVLKFPMDFAPLINILSSIASTSHENSNKVIELFKNLNGYTECLDKNRSVNVCVTSDINFMKLVGSKHLYPFGNLKIESGTFGQVSTFAGKQIIRWDCTLNGWQLFLHEIQMLLQQAAAGFDHVNHETLDHVLDIIKFCDDILKENSKAINSLKEITNMTYAIVERFGNAPSTPNYLIASCLKVVARIAECEPNEVWTNVLKMGILPHTTSNIKNFDIFSNVDMNGGVIGNLIASQEYMHGTYSITKAFLKLLSSVSQTLCDSNDQCFLACIMFVVREIFPTYHRWRYADYNDRHEIGMHCLQIFHKLLLIPDPLQTTSLKSSPIKKFILHSLLYTDLGLALLQVIETGDETLQLALEEQNNWCSGNKADLFHVVRLSLSVLNRLLLLKASFHKHGDPILNKLSPSETIIADQSSHIAKKHHIVLTVALYIFHRYDPRLTTLAVQLLKRFAKEVPIPLLACLGNDAEAIRDMFLVRLQSDTEDIRLKVAILEFLSVCAHQQPGLFEMFVNQSFLSNKKDSKDQFSCLQSVMDILEQKKEGLSSCRPELHLAAIKLIHSLWYSQKYLAIAALKKNENFWNLLCSPLFLVSKDHQPDDIISYIFKIISLELLYYSNEKSNRQSDINKVFEKFQEKKILTKCSNFISNISEFQEMELSEFDKSFEIEALNHSMYFISAWRDFLIVIAKRNNFEISSDDKKAIMSDILSSLINMLSSPSNMKMLVLVSQMYNILLESWKSSCVDVNSQEWFQRITDLLSSVLLNIECLPNHIQLFIVSICLKSLKLCKASNKIDKDNLVKWLRPVCTLVKLTCMNLSSVIDNFNINLPVVNIYLLQEIIAQLDDSYDWLLILRNEVTISSLLSLAFHCLKAMKGSVIVQAIFNFFLKLAENESSAEALCACGLIEHICLPLCSTYANNLESNKLKWNDVYNLSLQLMTSIFKTMKHFFFEDAVKFVGVHMDRMHQSLLSIKYEPTDEHIEECMLTLNLLGLMFQCKSIWKIAHEQSLNLFLQDICLLCQYLVSYLMRPNYLLHLVKNKSADHNVKIRSQALHRLSSTEEIEVSPSITEIQKTLMKLLSISLICLRQFCPSMHELLSDQNIAISECIPLLQIGFGTPSLDQDTPINFGMMISCINICLRYLVTKSESSVSPSKGEKQNSSFEKSLLIFTLENALAFLISQATLYLLNPNLSARDKQLIKRELGTELTSFTVSLNRCMKRSSGAPPSPATPGITQNVLRSATSPGKMKNLSALSEYPFIRLIALLIDNLFK